MTKDEAIAEVCSKARGEVGYYTTGSASNGTLYSKYAKEINEKYKGFYNGNKNGYDWCTSFVDWCFLETFGFDNTCKMTNQGGNNTAGASSTSSFNYFKAMGTKFWGTTPHVGAQAFIAWAPNLNTVVHTGLVVAVTRNSIDVIEGNTGGTIDGVKRNSCVRLRQWQPDGGLYGDGKIVGYGYPDWSVVSDLEVEPDVPEPTVKSKGIYIQNKFYKAKIWNGSKWVDTTPKIWNRSKWVDSVKKD